MNKKILTALTVLSLSLYTTMVVTPVYAEDGTATPTPTTTVTTTPKPTATTTPRAQTRQEALAKLKEANLKRAKELAIKIFRNHFLPKLNAVRVRVTTNTALGSDAKAILLAKIDEELSWFTEQLGKINDATTLEQVRTYTKEARVRFTQTGKDVRKLYIAHGFITSLERVVKNIETNIIPKIENKLTTLAGKGVDVMTETALLAKAKTELAAVKVEVTEIRNSTTYEMAKKNYDEARAHVKLVRQHLKDLLASLKTKV